MSETNLSDMHVHLTRAVMSNNTKLAKQFIDMGADVNYGEGAGNGSTLLHTAIPRCKPEIIELLLQSGANPNAVSKYESTPSHLAARVGNGKAIYMLHSHGANVDSIQHKDAKQSDLSSGWTGNGAGLTPLHIATIREHPKAIAALIQCGADIDKRCSLDNLRPIDYAVKGSPVEAILIEAHAQKSKDNIYTELYGDGIDVESVGQATPQRKRKM